MRNFLKSILFLFVILTTVLSCTDYDDNPSAIPVQDFIWKGLNYYYLYQPQVPDLNDAKFANQSDLDNYLASFASPEALQLVPHF